MRAIPRILEKQVKKAARAFGAVVITGPRRSGKTWLLRQLFPDAQYYLFEDPDLVGRFRADPKGFLDGVTGPAIFDEIQNVPEIFNFVRSRIDAAPRKKGVWLMTGSQESSLMRNVTESMAGRAAILHLLPLSLAESPRVSLLHGGYPEVVTHAGNASMWFASYVQTYLERDVRGASAVQSLATFRRFMSLLAIRHGAMLNMSELAAPLGVSVPTVSRWVDVLETSGLIQRVPPYYENFGKRLVKTPKIYWLDAGLACHLLGIQTTAELERSPFLGSLFEGMVASEIVKSQINAGRRKELYYFRDQQGLEVDFIVPATGGTFILVEAKATRTPTAAMAKPMLSLASAWSAHQRASQLRPSILVHRPAKTAAPSSAIAPGCKAMSIGEFIDYIG